VRSSRRFLSSPSRDRVGSRWCFVPIGWFFFVLEGSDATAGSVVGFCFAGGKAKPLKAPKADKKEYDEVCCYALDLVPVSLLD
jgi:hypothetical protein